MPSQQITQRTFKLQITSAPKPAFSDCYRQTLSIRLVNGPALQSLDVDLFQSGIIRKIGDLPHAIVDPMFTFMGYTTQAFEIAYIGPTDSRKEVENAFIALFLDAFNAEVQTD
jgi:hypothetical protein